MIFASIAHTSAAQPIGNRNGPTTSTTATCAFLIDVTGSGSREARRTEAEALSRNLTAAFRALDCDLVHIVPFAGTMFSAITEFRVPRAEARPCTTSQAPNVSAVLYKDVAERQRARADSACNARLVTCLLYTSRCV